MCMMLLWNIYVERCHHRSLSSEVWRVCSRGLLLKWCHYASAFILWILLKITPLSSHSWGGQRARRRGIKDRSVNPHLVNFYSLMWSENTVSWNFVFQSYTAVIHVCILQVIRLCCCLHAACCLVFSLMQVCICCLSKKLTTITAKSISTICKSLKKTAVLL